MNAPAMRFHVEVTSTHGSEALWRTVMSNTLSRTLALRDCWPGSGKVPTTVADRTQYIVRIQS